MAARLILASNSASRKMLMTGAKLDFSTQPADVDERAIESELTAGNATPPEIAVALAKAKALDVSRKSPNTYVIGSDQVLSLEGRLMHKPADMADAGDHIRAMSGRTHHLNCGVAIAHQCVVVWSDVSIARMTMRPISEPFLENYLAMAGEGILGSVGAYHFEGPGIQLFEKIEGDYFTILGLPMLTLLAGLRELDLIDA
ncbi:Maf family protein [Rhizobium sp.]